MKTDFIYEDFLRATTSFMSCTQSSDAQFAGANERVLIYNLEKIFFKYLPYESRHKRMMPVFEENFLWKS